MYVKIIKEILYLINSLLQVPPALHQRDNIIIGTAPYDGAVPLQASGAQEVVTRLCGTSVTT